ncbi:MAG: hypothetical protein KJ062_04700 [Thermoanaerobaculia bacterium]|nr:hypothetical protein [Thermoanaerobaculia bacterium]
MTLVFDNLDQLSPTSASLLLEICRVAHRSSHLAAILCLRPATFFALSSRDGAKAFVTTWLSVRAPSALYWLQQLAVRIRQTVDADVATGKTCRRFGDTALTGSVLEGVFSGLIELFVNRRVGEDVVGAMEAMAADNMRNFALLLRRILAHRDLPVAWLVERAGSAPRFHPLRAAMEGASTAYTHSDLVPNLFALTPEDEPPDFLVLYRTLTLAGTDRRPVTIATILQRASALGHSVEAVQAALRRLLAGGLLASPDWEWSLNGTLPSGSLYRTEAGLFFQNTLLRTREYATAAAFDTPLNHDSVRPETAARFGPRLSSYLEFMRRVRLAEEVQVAGLLSRDRSPQTAYLAYALGAGGLFSKRLLDALRDVQGAAERSKSLEVREMLPLLARELQAAASWLTGCEEKLLQVATGSRVPGTSAAPTALRLHPDELVRVDLVDAGDRANAVVSLSRPNPDRCEVILVSGTNPRPFLAASIHPPRAHPSGSDSGVSEAEAAAAIPLRRFDHQEGLTGIQTQTRVGRVSFSAAAGTPRDGYLCCEERDGLLTTRLVVPGVTVAPIDLGQRRIEDVESSVKAALERINATVLAPSSAHPPLAERVITEGLELATALWDRAGFNQVWALRQAIANLVVLSRQARVPYDWFGLPVDGTSGMASRLSEHFDVFHLPFDELADFFTLIESRNHRERHRRLGVTAGLGASPSAEWRCLEPSSFSELASAVRTVDVLHLVGHNANGAIELLSNKLRLSAGDVRAHLRYVPRVVVLSFCKGAGIGSAPRLARELARISQGQVYAPVVSITSAHAEAVDRGLRSWGCASSQLSLSAHLSSDASLAGVWPVFIRVGVPTSDTRVTRQHGGQT